MNRSRRLAVLLGIAATVMAGCSGVPTSSPPQTIRPVGAAGIANNVPGPPRVNDPRLFMKSFLAANWAEPKTLQTARKFLTAGASKSWSPTSKATIITDARQSTISRQHTVTVTGRALGTLNADGAYTPSFNEAVKFTYTLETSDSGQLRIRQLQDGLVITDDVFNQHYFARPIYFYDAADKYLVPFVRYSALSDQGQLANWLLNQLARPPDQTIVGPEALPPQAHRPTATIGAATTRVQIAGSRQLEPDARDRLAAQVSQTLAKSNVTTGGIQILDGLSAISIPSAHGSVFKATEYAEALGPADPPPRVNYVVGGKVVDQAGKPLPGPVDDERYFYTSVALASRTAGTSLAVAGVVGTGDRQQLVVGNTETGMERTEVPRGALSRPSWAPGRDEVWVGDGAKVYRVVTGGKTPVVRTVPTSPAPGGGRIVALRLSPDGARIAMVVSGSHGSGQVFVGSVVRGAGSPQVVDLQAISSTDAVITDVAWNYALRLTAIGYSIPSSDAGVFEVGVDGANWADSGTTGLPAAPTSVTATADAAWVSAEGYVWTRNSQSASSWISPGPTGQTTGTNPVYLG